MTGLSNSMYVVTKVGVAQQKNFFAAAPLAENASYGPKTTHEDILYPHL